MLWRHPQLYPAIGRSIGFNTRADADLLFVTEHCELHLSISTPNNLQVIFKGETHIWLSAVARGIDGESPSLRLRIDWDGKWERGEAEMTRHLKIEVAS